MGNKIEKTVPPKLRVANRLEDVREKYQSTKSECEDVRKKAKSAKITFQQLRRQRRDMFMQCFDFVAAKIGNFPSVFLVFKTTIVLGVFGKKIVFFFKFAIDNFIVQMKPTRRSHETRAPKPICLLTTLTSRTWMGSATIVSPLVSVSDQWTI